MSYSSTDQIRWYGERGIVNAIVTHIAGHNDHDKYVASVKAFLDAIKWADDSKPAWIRNIIDAWFAVEPDFGDFGAPDLMVVCKVDGAQHRYCVFIEAKTAPYWLCTGDNTAGMAGHYNSTINGQLSLKYRLAAALANPASSQAGVTETADMLAHYACKLGDRSMPPRHLKKTESLHMLADLELIGMPLANACFVAMTWDTESHIFFRPDHLVDPARHLPVFLGDDGIDRFGTMRSQVGWLGYAEVKSALQNLGSAFEHALGTMGIGELPRPANYTPRSVADWPAPIRDSCKALCEDLTPNASGWRYEEQKTGWSIIGPDGRTHVKVVLGPGPKTVYVGIQKVGRVPLDSAGLNVTGKIPGYEFFGVEIEEGMSAPDRIAALAPVVRELGKRL